MKKTLSLLFVIPCLILTGCATAPPAVRHAVVLSDDAERIAYDVAGQGHTSLIFVHGWSCDGRYWKAQMSEFANHYQVIAVDLAGHGHSSATRSDFTMPSFAQDIRAIIDNEGIQNAIIIGHSMGGAVAAEAAKLMPDKVIGIVGVDTLQNVAEHIPQGVIDAMTAPFEADFFTAAHAFVAPMFLQGADGQLVQWVTEDMSSAPTGPAISSFRHYLGQFESGQAAAVFAQVNVPVVSINTRGWPTAEEENRKHIKDYQLLYIEESGHFPMLEKPAEFNSLLRQALHAIQSER